MFYVWGANSYGQLGLGYTSEQENLPVATAEWKFSKITGGGGHTLAVDVGGNLFVCGWNRSGQLGIGHTNDASTFVQTNLTGVIDACGGWDFSLALMEDGSVFSCGSNRYLQLGRGDEKESLVFKKIPGLENIQQVDCGLRHACAVDKDGRVFSWGCGTKGQLGRILENCKNDLPRPIPDLDTAESVSCGQYFTIVKTSKSTLFGFGQNKFGEINGGPENMIHEPVQISLSDVDEVGCGWSHVAARKEGQCISWGRNNYGQCATGQFSPTHQLSEDVPNRDIASINYRKVVAGSEHTLALDNEGRVYSWGWNEHGNCGTGNVDNVAIPTQINFPVMKPVCDIFVGSAHCFAVI